ncbi:MAG TPA: peptidoglycan DD-metalloendopeptidase family protein [Thermoanaerobaculia bacterium]|nr:peptidoglycan DD-metalloendopeptidase family protein [Thermoanaerobaculia bacterium]
MQTHRAMGTYHSVIRFANRSAARRVFCAVLTLLFAAGLPAAPAEPRDRDLDRIRGEISRLRTTLNQLATRARTAEVEVQAVDLEVAIQTRELEIAAAAQQQLESQSVSLERDIESLTARIATQKVTLSRRLAALYRAGPLTYVQMFLSMDDREDPIRAASMLAFIVGRDARAVSDFQATRERLGIEQARLAEQRVRLDAVKKLVAERHRTLSETRARKEAMLARLQSEESTTVRKLSELEEKARRLENLFALLYGRKSPEELGGAQIEQFQGALTWPVEGKVIERFGRRRNPKFATITVSNGLKIEAAPGTEVRAVFEGTVLFSQWFKGYGNLVIVDHGNRIFSLYGNAQSPRVTVGDRVAPRQVVANVGYNEDGDSGYLYFEIRQDNKPVDPRTWLR